MTSTGPVPADATVVDGRTVLALPFDLDSLVTARGAMTDDLAGLGVADDQLRDVLIVASELLMNALVHGAPDADDQVLVGWVRTDDGAVEVLVEDAGGGPTEPHLESPRPGDQGGRGLILVDALTTAWAAERGEAGATRVRAIVPVERPR